MLRPKGKAEKIAQQILDIPKKKKKKKYDQRNIILSREDTVRER